MTMLAVLVSALILSPQAQAEASHPAYAEDCRPVEAIFARGSGQDPGGANNNAFNTELIKKLGPVGLGYYEVGTEELDEYLYPAVNVSDWRDNWNVVGAGLSGGQRNDYGKSVDTGAAEAGAYLEARAKQCPDSVFVLGGYSQGAQVIGETYENADTNIRKRIVYNALFGDPKLYLPEGKGIYPAACRGENFSEWRFNVPDCSLNKGSLGQRDPYLPEGWVGNTGLWCNDSDFVCGSSIVSGNAGHHTYDEEPTEEAVAEIVRRLRTTLPPAEAALLPPEVLKAGEGTTGLDVVFVIDTTGSMGEDIAGARETVALMTDWVERMRGRVALVEYRDAGDDFTARVLTGLQEDTGELNAKMAALEVDGGGDAPEALMHGLMTALNGLEWRNGATKAAVVLSDAGFHNPDLVDGTTLDQVARRALEIDPVNVYPVVDSWLVDEYAELAEATTGQVISTEGGDTAAALQEALTRLEERPVALLPLAEYHVPAGGTVTFDASKSYANNGASITSYSWDFDGDGVFESTTTSPMQTHAYKIAEEAIMQVRITDSNGLISNMSAIVHVDSPPQGRANLAAAPSEVQAEVVSISVDGPLSTVNLDWTPMDTLAESWAVAIDGFPIGRVAGETLSVHLTDVDLMEPAVIGVAAINEAGEIGEYATVVVPAAEEPIATPTASPSSPGGPVAPTIAPSPSGTPPTPAPGASPSAITPPAVVPAGSTPQMSEANDQGDPLADTGAAIRTAAWAGTALLGLGVILLLIIRQRSESRQDPTGEE